MSTKKVEGEAQEAKVLRVDRDILAGIIVSFIRGYRFNHEGEKPNKVILPIVNEVDGVPIEYQQVEVSNSETG